MGKRESRSGVSTARIFLVLCLTFSVLGGVPSILGAEVPSVEEWDVPREGLNLGNPDAPVTVTEYGGPGCYLCNRYFETIFPEFLEYVREGDVNYRYRHFPLETDGLDLALSRLAECAGNEGRFWSVRRAWVTGSYARSDTGLRVFLNDQPDSSSLRDCTRKDSSRERVLKQRRRAVKQGITGIPHVRIGDESIRGLPSWSAFQRVLHQELGRPWEPAPRIPEDSRLSVRNLRVEGDTDHRVELTFRYDYDVDTGHERRLRLRPLGESSRHFHSSSEQMVPGSDTVTLQLTYGSYNPQHEDQTIRTDGLRIVVDDREDRDYVQLHYPKTWSLHRFHPPSDTIPDDTTVNDVSNLRVTKRSSDEYEVTFDYTYRSDHGSHVYAGGSVRRDGDDASYSYRPASLKRGEHTATIEIGRRESSVQSNPRTDAIEIEFYVGGERVFYEKTFNRTLAWGKEAGDTGGPPDRTKPRPDGSLAFMKDLFERYSSLDAVPDSFVRTYFDRADDEDLLWLYDRIHTQFSGALKRNEEAFVLGLRVLREARDRGLSRSRARKSLSRLFQDRDYGDPLLEGRISKKTFERLGSLLEDLGLGDRMKNLRVPNLVRYHPDQTEWQLTASQLEDPLIVHFPDNYFVEYVDVRRPLSHLEGEDYTDAYEQLVSQQGSYTLYSSPTDRIRKGRMNRYYTQDYSVSVKSEGTRWLVLDFARAENLKYNTSLYVQAFEEPGYRVGPVPPDSGPQVVLEESAWFEELRALEWVRVTDGESVPRVLRNMDSGDTGTMASTIRMVLARKLDQRSKFLRAKNRIDTPLSDRVVKVLERHRALVWPFLGDDKAYEFADASHQEQYRFVLEAGAGNRYLHYEMARLEWVLGKFEKAAKHFRWLEKYVNHWEVLWPSARFYRISSLYRLGRRSEAKYQLRRYLSGTELGLDGLFPGPERETYVDVEGLFVSGQPRRNYLRNWLRVMEEGKRSWWYERIGFAEKSVPHFRFFTSRHDDESIGKLVATALRERTDAAIGYMNHKGMRSGLPEGPVRRNELFAVLPWNNSVKLVPGRPPESGDTSTLRGYLEELPYPPADLGGRGSDAVISAGKVGVEELRTKLKKYTEEDGSFSVFVMPDYVLMRTDDSARHRQSRRTDREMLERYIERVSPINPEDYGGFGEVD